MAHGTHGKTARQRNYAANTAERLQRRARAHQGYAAGMTHAAIAAELGIDRTTVTYYLNRAKGAR